MTALANRNAKSPTRIHAHIGLALPGKESREVAQASPSERAPGPRRWPRRRAGAILQTLLAFLCMLPFGVPAITLAQVGKTSRPTQPGQPGQPQRPKEQHEAQRIFSIKHADVEAVARSLQVFGVRIHTNRDLRVIGVSASPALLHTIEDTIRRLDVPPPTPKNVEVTAYLLIASSQETDEGPVPADLESVIKQLKANFVLKAFRLLDTLVIRSRDTTGGKVAGLARENPKERYPLVYTFSYDSATVQLGEPPRSIRLDGLKLDAKIVVRHGEQGAAASGHYSSAAGFSAAIDVREGQKVVVGKAAAGEANSALIVVISAKVLD